MSTSAIIKVEGINFVELYKHWDGDPESTLPWLEDFNHRFVEQRDDDLVYKIAQILRDSIVNLENFNLDGSPTTGWGLVEPGMTGGIEYTYTLHIDGSVTYAE
jgi:hypothetical protein